MRAASCATTASSRASASSATTSPRPRAARRTCIASCCCGMRAGAWTARSSTCTGHRAAFNLAGPASREVLQPLTDIDLSEAAFPFLGVREGKRRGRRRARAARGFRRRARLRDPRAVSAGGAALWDALMNRPATCAPFGVEAQRVLRLEKGHVIVAQDTDDLTNPVRGGSRLGGAHGQAVLRRPAQPAHPRAARCAPEAGRLRACADAGAERRAWRSESADRATATSRGASPASRTHRRSAAPSGSPWRCHSSSEPGMRTRHPRQRWPPGRARAWCARRSWRARHEQPRDAHGWPTALPERRVGIKGPRAAELLEAARARGAGAAQHLGAAARTWIAMTPWNVVAGSGFTEFFLEEARRGRPALPRSSNSRRGDRGRLSRAARRPRARARRGARRATCWRRCAT